MSRRSEKDGGTKSVKVRFTGQQPGRLIVGDKELIAGGDPVELTAEELEAARAAASVEILEEVNGG